MKILLNSLKKNHRLIGHFSKSLFHDKLIRYCGIRFNHSINEDTFGIGSKYVELDTKANKFSNQENLPHNKLEIIEEKFGNLSANNQDQ